jgi:hypothetical protein
MRVCLCVCVCVGGVRFLFKKNVICNTDAIREEEIKERTRTREFSPKKLPDRNVATEV